MASSTAVFVGREEYLQTAYRPDRDWIDGEVRERNLGEQTHARVQAFLAYLFRLHCSKWGVRGLVEQRVQTSPTKFRIPDVCAIALSAPAEEIVRTPPLLCIEILSREDRMSEIQERVEDYLAMGVAAVWVIDPRRRRAYTSVVAGAMEAASEELTVAGSAIRVRLAEIFAELDEMEAGD